VHCKPAYQRQNKDHYKDNLLTVMQVFGNATDFSLCSKTVQEALHTSISVKCFQNDLKDFTYGIEVYSRHQTISLKQHQGS
jgi:hypothetical protein